MCIQVLYHDIGNTISGPDIPAPHKQEKPVLPHDNEAEGEEEERNHVSSLGSAISIGLPSSSWQGLVHPPGHLPQPSALPPVPSPFRPRSRRQHTPWLLHPGRTLAVAASTSSRWCRAERTASSPRCTVWRTATAWWRWRTCTPRHRLLDRRRRRCRLGGGDSRGKPRPARAMTAVEPPVQLPTWAWLGWD